MHKEGDEVHVSDTEASGGSKEGVVRWVLGIGLVLAILFLSLIWIVPAAMQGDVEEEATVSGKIQSMENGESTDSIIEPESLDGTSDGDSADTDADTIQN